MGPAESRQQHQSCPDGQGDTPEKSLFAQQAHGFSIQRQSRWLAGMEAREGLIDPRSKRCTSMIEVLTPVTMRDGSYTRAAENLEIAQRLFQWYTTQKCPPDLRMAMQLANGSWLPPSNATFRKFNVMLIHDAVEMDPKRSTVLAMDLTHKISQINMQRQRGPLKFSFRGFSINGLVWAGLENTVPGFQDMSEAKGNLELLKLNQGYHNSYPGRTLRDFTFHRGHGQWLSLDQTTNRDWELLRSIEDPAANSGHDVAWFDEKHPFPINRVSQLSMDNHQEAQRLGAEDGLVARNGMGVACLSWIGCPPIYPPGGEREFAQMLRNLHMVDCRHPDRIPMWAKRKRFWDNLLRPVSKEVEFSGLQGQSNLVMSIFMGDSTDERLDNSSPKLAPMKWPMPFSGLYGKFEQEARMNEVGVYNRFNEGWAAVQMITPPLGKGLPNIPELQLEWVKKVVRHINNFPWRKWEEVHFAMEYMPLSTILPGKKSSSAKVFSITLMYRFSGEQPEKLNPEDREIKLPKFGQEIPDILASGIHKKCYSSRQGFENLAGNGMAVVDAIGKPITDERRTPAGDLNRFLRALNGFSEEHPDRKILRSTTLMHNRCNPYTEVSREGLEADEFKGLIFFGPRK